MESAEGEELPLSEGTQVLADALVLAEALASGGLDVDAALASVRQHSPETARLGERFARIIDVEQGVSPDERRVAMRRLLTAVDDEFAKARFQWFRATSVLAID